MYVVCVLHPQDEVSEDDIDSSFRNLFAQLSGEVRVCVGPGNLSSRYAEYNPGLGVGFAVT